ncbi:class A beta-lactamase [Flexivirga meconopsidis]|uniref:class A beta-lactamase n=1 Tax=Flexivirga meconopsidis TaxID=2977121 RepID=UPI003CC54968
MARRSALAASLPLGAVLLAGCAPGTSQPRPSASAGAASTALAASAELAALERRFGGRLGLSALDTGTGRRLAHRADERFLMCSTHKLLVVGAILQRDQQQPGLLRRRVRYGRDQLLEYAPVTSRHVADGMTVSQLCDAAITRSDNTAANLLTRLAGGPAEVTEFVRTLGDSVTRLDRTEPDLNVSAPGDVRDTTTPAHMATDLHALTLGDGALAAAGRNRMVGWLKANKTGATSIRAGLPTGWPVGDKTGSGSRGEINDVAVIWPPGRAPLIVSIYTAPQRRDPAAGYRTVADAARIAVSALVPNPV